MEAIRRYRSGPYRRVGTLLLLVAGLLVVAVTPALAAPSIELDVTADPDFGTPGTRITFTYAVTNTGDVPLVDVTVTDNRFGEVGGVATLDPGGAASFVEQEVLGGAPIRLVAVARAKGDPGRAVRARDVATVTVIAAGDAPTDPASGLAFTGVSGGPLAAASVLLLVTGVTLLTVGSRPRDTD